MSPATTTDAAVSAPRSDSEVRRELPESLIAALVGIVVVAALAGGGYHYYKVDQQQKAVVAERLKQEAEATIQAELKQAEEREAYLARSVVEEPAKNDSELLIRRSATEEVLAKQQLEQAQTEASQPQVTPSSSSNASPDNVCQAESNYTSRSICYTRECKKPQFHDSTYCRIVRDRANGAQQ